MGAERGSVVTETVLSLFLFLLLCAYFVEVCRRPLYELQAEWASFLAARAALIEGPRRSQSRLRRKLKSGLATLQTDRAVVRVSVSAHKVQGEAYIRFPSLFTFPWQRFHKRGFQLVRTCTFSFR